MFVSAQRWNVDEFRGEEVTEANDGNDAGTGEERAGIYRRGEGASIGEKILYNTE